MRNPYEVLGVASSASEAEIKTAYRNLAKQLHPDVCPDNTRIVERFKELTAAYDLLKDPVRRRRYDRGETDLSRPSRRRSPATRQRARQTADGPGPGDHANAAWNWTHTNGQASGAANGHAHGTDHVNGANGARATVYSDMFADIFNNLKSQTRRDGAVRGVDRSYRLKISFLDSVNGATRRLRLAEGRRVDVHIPPGIREGQQIRLRGAGGPGEDGGPDGDALIGVEIQPHAHFERRGDDIHLELPVSLTEAVLGGRIKVPTVVGPVQITVPPGSNTGTILRLKGRGVSARGVTGDQYVTLKIVLADNPPKDFVKTIRRWAERWQGNVRAALGLE